MPPTAQADADALGKLLELPRRGATEDRRSREA
jgi:hypothetical protein